MRTIFLLTSLMFILVFNGIAANHPYIPNAEVTHECTVTCTELEVAPTSYSFFTGLLRFIGKSYLSHKLEKFFERLEGGIKTPKKIHIKQVFNTYNNSVSRYSYNSHLESCPVCSGVHTLVNTMERNELRWEELESEMERINKVTDQRLTELEKDFVEMTERVAKAEEKVRKNADAIKKNEVAINKNNERIADLQEEVIDNTYDLDQVENQLNGQKRTIHQNEEAIYNSGLELAKLSGEFTASNLNYSIEMGNRVMIINYDLENCTDRDYFFVDIRWKGLNDDFEYTPYPASISGDAGENVVRCGKQRIVKWDFNKAKKKSLSEGYIIVEITEIDRAEYEKPEYRTMVKIGKVRNKLARQKMKSKRRKRLERRLRRLENKASWTKE